MLLPLLLPLLIGRQNVTEYPRWFAGAAEENFTKFLSIYSGQVGYRALQVGVFTGDASLWLMENVLTHHSSTLVDVDTWEGSDEGAHHEMNFADVEHTYDAKLMPYRNRIKYKMTSEEFFKHVKLGLFDFAYIDGDHTAKVTFEDGEAAWYALKPSGILAFDDYQWGDGLADQSLAPKPGIDKFLDRHMGEYDLLEKGAQVWVKKHANI